MTTATRGTGQPAGPQAVLTPLAFSGVWEYDPAPEKVRPAIRERYGLFIGGEFVDPAGGKWFASVSPATDETICEVGEAGAEDVDRAVKAARKALPAWKKMPAKERGKLIYRLARRIQERARELAVLESMDGGKAIRESRDVDVPLAAAHFFYHAGWADKLRFAFAGKEPEPIGVCGQVIPWNFPLLMAAWKVAPALACGNTVVLKPAETTPLTALVLGEICREVGIPKGVVNIVTGAGATGAAIVNHPGVDKIAFTGSTEVGKVIARAVAGTQKKLTLELGGKSPNIIFEDASIDQAIEGIIQGIYFNQGHVCCAGSRLFVQESVLPEVVAKLEHRLKSLRVGDPLDKNTDVGAINSKAQLATIEKYLDSGREEGATLHEANGSALPERGNWCRPCFFTGVQPSHTIAREEIFGPVLAVMSFRTPEEAISRANNTPYGLAAGVWTDKGSKIFEIASKLKAGVVWLNTYNKFDPASPFGGFKESGFGREGGMHGLRAYVRV
ncbi:MAG: aldehyde dehydrogenase family protein [Phycisphaerales bacterium]